MVAVSSEARDMAVAMLKAGHSPQTVVSALIQRGSTDTAAQTLVGQLLELKHQAEAQSVALQQQAIAANQQAALAQNQNKGMLTLVMGIIFVLCGLGGSAMGMLALKAAHDSPSREYCDSVRDSGANPNLLLPSSTCEGYEQERSIGKMMVGSGIGAIIVGVFAALSGVSRLRGKR
jgi:hypothetical protein